MLRSRSSLCWWLLALIVGSVFAQDVRITVNNSKTETAENSQQIMNTVNPIEVNTESSSTAANASSVSSSSIDDPEEATARSDDIQQITTAINLTEKFHGNQPIPQAKSRLQLLDARDNEEKEKETSRKGTIQFVVNAPTTRYPPHYYTTPYTHPPPPPHHHHYYSHHPPYHHHHEYPSARPPYPGYDNYPGYGYPGYPGNPGYPGYRPPYPGYPGYGYPGYPGYGYPPYGYPPWYFPNSTDARAPSDVNIAAEIVRKPVKTAPFFGFFNFGGSSKK